jgi:hypothetical protein
MGRWGWIIAAAALLVVGVLWWRRRDKAMKGTLNTTGAPAGAGPGGVLAAMMAIVRPAGETAPKVQLPPVGQGTVVPSQIVNPPTQPAAVKSVNGCVPPKVLTKVTKGSTTSMQCR